jgi:hypothetical protein
MDRVEKALESRIMNTANRTSVKGSLQFVRSTADRPDGPNRSTSMDETAAIEAHVRIRPKREIGNSRRPIDPRMDTHRNAL